MKFFVGYELGDRYCQISYCPVSERMPETVSQVAGGGNYNIPTLLFKRRGVNRWLFGRAAMEADGQQEGEPVDKLLKRAIEGEKVLIDGEEYDPVALLTLFIKRSLTLLAGIGSLDKIEGVMFTSKTLRKEEVEVLRRVLPGLGLKTREIYFQGYEDSIYYYNLYQETQTWSHQVLVCEYWEDRIRIYRMERNRKTTPTVVFMHSAQYPFENCEKIPAEDYFRRETLRKMDREFLKLMEEICADRMISSVYLLGEGFQGDWMQESLRFLCKNRRVFQGNNLFSKGACYSMIEKHSASDAGKSHVFLSRDKLKANIGMKVLRRGTDSYFALLDGGNNWYEAKGEVDFLLEEGNEFQVIITPLNGKDVKNLTIQLNGLPVRPHCAARLHLQVEMLGENRVQFLAEDMGFGELFPATHMSWKEILNL